MKRDDAVICNHPPAAQIPSCRAEEYRGRILRKTWCMGPYAGVDYNLTLCPLQIRLQHIYPGQPSARVGLNPTPESTLSPSQGLWIWPQLLLSHTLAEYTVSKSKYKGGGDQKDGIGQI
jgi:hypothetical protein